MANKSWKHLDLAFLNDSALIPGFPNLGSLNRIPMAVHGEGRDGSWAGKEGMQWRGFSASRHCSHDY